MVTAIILFIIVIIRPPTLSDYHAYVDLFYYGADRMEPTFTLISSFLRNRGFDFLALFAIYGLLSIMLKITALRLMSPNFYLSILVWLCNTFFYHDLIQIRVSVACGCLLWMIYTKIKGNIKVTICLFVIACLFHYTSFIALFIFFLSDKKTYKPFYYCLIPISYIFYFCGISISSIIPILGLSSLTTLYEAYSQHDSEANVFNLIQICRCCICLWLWVKVEYIQKLSPYFLITLKIFTIGCAMAALFGEFIRVSFRLAELLWSVETLLFPFLTYSLYPIKKKAIFIPITVCLILFYLMFNNSHWETGDVFV